MLHLGSLVLGSLVFLCSVFAPAGLADGIDRTDEIHYFDTVYATGDEPMPIDNTSVTIPYITKTQVAANLLATQCPQYTYSPALGSCAAIAGGNVIGYYDRFDEDLIPNHKSGIPYKNTYIYNLEDDGVVATIKKLYEYMIGDGYGATENEFKNGITRYCNEKGKTITFSSCMQNGSFSYSSTKSYLDAGLPIVLFLSGYNVGDLYSGENSDSIYYYVSNANHIMIAFGYEEYLYTTSGGTVTYNYLSVSSGQDANSAGLYNISLGTKINDALAVNIY